MHRCTLRFFCFFLFLFRLFFFRFWLPFLMKYRFCLAYVNGPQGGPNKRIGRDLRVRFVPLTVP